MATCVPVSYRSHCWRPSRRRIQTSMRTFSSRQRSPHFGPLGGPKRPKSLAHCAADAEAQVLERLWGGEETLILIISDLSHYLPYEQAQALDRATAQRILRLDAALAPHEACGATAINGAP